MYSLEQLTAIKDKILADRVSIKESIKFVVPDFDLLDQEEYKNICRDLFANFKELRKEVKIIDLEIKIKNLNDKIEKMKNS